RVGKRFEEAAFERMLRAVESATGRLFSEDDHRKIARGADEIDLVNSGLEETMIGAYRPLRDLMRQDARVKDLRTAAFLNAPPEGCDPLPRAGYLPLGCRERRRRSRDSGGLSPGPARSARPSLIPGSRDRGCTRR